MPAHFDQRTFKLTRCNCQPRLTTRPKLALNELIIGDDVVEKHQVIAFAISGQIHDLFRQGRLAIFTDSGARF